MVSTTINSTAVTPERLLPHPLITPCLSLQKCSQFKKGIARIILRDVHVVVEPYHRPEAVVRPPAGRRSLLGFQSIADGNEAIGPKNGLNGFFVLP